VVESLQIGDATGSDSGEISDWLDAHRTLSLLIQVFSPKGIIE
jgi:hypothetical protein